MKKFATVLIILTMLLSSFLTANAENYDVDSDGDRIFSISRGGDTAEFDENSIEAFSSAIQIGFDAVSAEICENEDGKLVLKNSSTSLSDLLKLTENKVFVIIDVTPDLLENAYTEALNFSSVIFRCREMKNKDFLNWAKEKEKELSVIPAYSGNVIFSAISTYNFAEENGTRLVSFNTKNRYGVIFSRFFTNRFAESAALISLYDNDLSGQRTDDVIGWENLISLGYSAIETGNAREFAAYMNLLSESTDKLQKAFESANATDFTKFDKSSGDSLKKCLKKAEKALTVGKAISSFDANRMISEIAKATDELKASDGENETSIKITPMKIFWIIFALALFVSSQAYLYKKTNKK